MKQNKLPELKGKKVLLIGSGNDIDGRAMQNIIDNSNEYDIIARVNKPYGFIKDIGLKTDIIFMRHSYWRNRFWPHFRNNYPPIVAFRGGINCSIEYDKAISKRYNLKLASTGLCAIHWLVEEAKVDNVAVIGFGYKDGGFIENKTYTGTSIQDPNKNFDWHKEQDIFKEMVTLI